ncbi:MAG: SDR family NAD(P)-dependent oxidoreductase [Bacteroidota bacterium]
MDLKEAKIIVTGGSSGIGKASAQLLREAGATVLITGRNLEKLTAVAQEIGVLPLQLEMTEYGTLNAKAEEAVKLLGGVDALINNAGLGEFATLGNIELAHFEKVFGANVFGLALFTQAILPHFIAQERGDIVNIASTAALNGFAYGTVYAASKFALRGMTQCWQKELRKHNIRVVLVNPSEVPTAFAQADRTERPDEPSKLTSFEIAHTIRAALKMHGRGFIPEVTVWATNPK